MLFNKCFEADDLKEESKENVNYREAVRGIIIKNNKILLVHSKNNDYKFPGGGIKRNEGKIEALIREIEEETGYVPKLIKKKIGKVSEKSRDKYSEDRIFKMISYYYEVEVAEEIHEQNLDAYEAELEFKPVWMNINDAIKNNESLMKLPADKRPNWIERETYVLKEIKLSRGRF